MAPKTANLEPQLFLEKLELGVTGTIILMVYRMWDVYASTGHYLSSEFVVCDAKGSTMHITARGNIAHNFLRLKEDAVGYVTNVDRTVHQKTGSKILDFHLANSRGQAIRVTLWGSLGEFEAIQCTSSTLILDDEQILEVNHLKVDRSKEILPVGCLEEKAGGRLEFTCRHAWQSLMAPSKTLEFKMVTPTMSTTRIKALLARGLLLLKGWARAGDHMRGGMHNHCTLRTLNFKRLSRHHQWPSLKLVERKKHKRLDLEDSNAEASFVADTQTRSEVDGSRPDTRKNKRFVVNDSASG
ncbi:hypothetical protein Tco_0793561 [Tanacetum coccineum]